MSSGPPDLKSDPGTGVILFDRAKGRIVSMTAEHNLQGSLDIDIGGMKTTIELEQRQKTTVKNTDQNPLK